MAGGLVIAAIAVLSLLSSVGQGSVETSSPSELPTGHLKPLGHHRPADKEIDSYNEVLSPEAFWEKYASKRKPVVFRGAANNSAAAHLWTDEYLIRKFGRLEVKLEGKREKLGKQPVGEVGVGRDTIENFLKTYKSEDKYIVSQLPEPMYHEVSVLPCLLCGTFKKRLLEVNLWVSSGGSRSLLHRDADNAINCLLHGRKDWIMVDPEYDDFVSMAEEDEGALGGFSLVNVDKVNLLKHPKFKNVHWTYSNLTAGDCIFIPYGHFHQVRSFERNVAVSVLFARLTEFSTQSDCPANGSTPPWDLLSNQHIAWSYPGHGEMSMGNSDPEHVRNMFMNVLTASPGNVLDKQTFLEEVCTAKELPIRPPGQSYGPDFEECWSLVDPDNDGLVTLDDIAGLPHPTLQRLTVFIDQDPANMPDYEYYSLSHLAVKSFVERVLHGKSKVTREEFVRRYVEMLHGSEAFGQKLFAKLDRESRGFLTSDDTPVDGSAEYDEYYKDYGKDDIAGEQFHKVLREDYDPEEYEDLEQYDAGTTVHLYSDSQPEGSNADGAVADGTKDIVQDVMTKTEL